MKPTVTWAIPPLGTLVAATFTHLGSYRHYIGVLAHVVPAKVVPTDEEIDKYFLEGWDLVVADQVRPTLRRPGSRARWILQRNNVKTSYTIIIPDSPNWTLHQVLPGRPNKEKA